MNIESFEKFESEALAAGFEEALVREWAPHQVIAMHSHPFDASAVVTQGEMWLTCDGDTQYLTRGGTFDLPRGKPHSERYGPEGAVYWVARRSI